MTDKEMLLKLVLTIESNPKGRTRMFLKDESTGFPTAPSEDITIWDVPDLTDALVLAHWMVGRLKDKAAERSLGNAMVLDLGDVLRALVTGGSRKDS